MNGESTNREYVIPKKFMSSDVRSCGSASFGGVYTNTCNSEYANVAFPKKNTNINTYIYILKLTISVTSMKVVSTANLDVNGIATKNSIDPAIVAANLGAVYIIPVMAILDLVKTLL